MEPSIRLTAERRHCGQVAGEPSEEADQSWARIRAAISVSPERKPSAGLWKRPGINFRQTAFLIGHSDAAHRQARNGGFNVPSGKRFCGATGADLGIYPNAQASQDSHRHGLLYGPGGGAPDEAARAEEGGSACGFDGSTPSRHFASA
ncbi:hypothetical protein H0176_00680 [Methylorubrum populi]|uniref:Uncharacterized protein n=1 Tax=Methylorubrum rhodesianum TaxID=29427 RepID=A0ABU9Z4U9_9HYPH|nr:hypothetical protein [Methylorubrum rhodesianum]MBK3402655.1 hypothetical protein [Methylorubrum rhodesianum]MBY0138796.1 hypothetical protein [Methylorubrum populi]